MSDKKNDEYVMNRSVLPIDARLTTITFTVVEQPGNGEQRRPSAYDAAARAMRTEFGQSVMSMKGRSVPLYRGTFVGKDEPPVEPMEGAPTAREARAEDLMAAIATTYDGDDPLEDVLADVLAKAEAEGRDLKKLVRKATP